MKIIVYILLFCFGIHPLMGQTRTVDSLKKNILFAENASGKIRAIFSLCNLGYSLHPDTLMKYALLGTTIAKERENLEEEITGMYHQSAALTNKGLIDSSLDMANKCLGMVSGKINNPALEGNLFNQKGRCFMRKNQYKEAAEMGYRVIESGEMAKDTLLQIKGKTLLGWAYLEMGQTNNALAWHLRALRTTDDTLIHEKYGILFANLALNYGSLGKMDSGFYYINKAIVYSRRHENLFGLSNSLAIQAQLYVRTEQSKLAEEPLKEVVAIRKLIGDPFYIVSDMSQLGLYYAHNGQPDKGIAICEEGIAIAREYKIGTKLFFLYNTLAENYKAKGSMKEYAGVLEKIIALKDSVYGNNTAEALAELQTRFEVQQKENTIIQQQLTLTRKNYLFYGSLGLSLLGAIFAYFLFRGYRKRQALKIQMMTVQEKEAVATAEEKERKRIAADLHDNLGAYAASIVSNVENLPLQLLDEKTGNAARELKTNSQSIVSDLNDTIWALKKDLLSLTSISDRLKIFISRLQKSYPSISIEVEEQIRTDHQLPASQAFQLYRILQEAVNNSLKHSNGKKIIVRISGDKNWKVTVADDGEGITDSQLAFTSGNGMMNMKARSKEAGWNINWVCSERIGTVVEISPTTN